MTPFYTWISVPSNSSSHRW